MFSSSSRVPLGRLIAVEPAPACSRHGVRHLSGVGLVGLPNIGKSTLFNSLVRQQLAAAANFPFCTINPQTATAVVPDARLKALALVNKSESCIPQTLEIVDIAGLIAGASKGDGLGNAFLANVRETSAILEVVRCFTGSGGDGDGGEEILHVMSSCDPVRDIGIIEAELALADLQSIEKRLGGGAGGKGKMARTPEGAVLAKLLASSRELLEDGLPARLLESTLSPSERPLWPRLQLITQKPLMYVCNIGEGDVRAGGNDMTRAVKEHVQERARALVGRAGVPPAAAAAALADCDSCVSVVCAKLEAELAVLPDEERLEYLREYGLDQSGMDGLLARLAALLRQQVFYTAGPVETRAWAIPVGTTAQEAAGAIHSDIAKGFIKAEVTGYGDYMAAGGEEAARKAAVTRAEGKDYVMRDGDVVHFRHSG